MNRRTFFKGWAVAIAAVLLGSKSLASTVEVPRREKTALELFRPTPTQELVIRSLASGDEVIAIGGHRCGKGVVAAACVAAMATGKPITMRDGSKVYLKLNSPTIIIVGNDWFHQRRSIQPHLFMKGLFRVVQEEGSETRRWDPSTSEDLDRFRDGKTSPSQPLISRKELTDIQWQNKKERTMKSCVVKSTGVKIVFCSSCDRRHIGPVGAVWIDESMEDDILYPEFLMQLCDTQGKMLWTTFPYHNQPQLIKAVDRIEVNPLRSSVVRLKHPFYTGQSPEVSDR